MKTNKLLILGIVIVTIIPISLNFLLQIETGLKILGGDDSQWQWLSFWGDYLAAIGSFAMALISYKINKHAIKQNKEILDNYTSDKFARRYKKYETYITHIERLYCNCYVDEIISQLKCHKEEKGYILAKYRRNSSVPVLGVIKFMEQEKACEYNNDTGKELNSYGCFVKSAEVHYSQFLNKLENNNSNLDNFKDDNKELIEEIRRCYENIKKQGLRVLQEEKRRMEIYAKKHGFDSELVSLISSF